MSGSDEYNSEDNAVANFVLSAEVGTLALTGSFQNGTVAALRNNKN